MKTNDLLHLLKNNPYPGRGIMLGKTPDGRKALAVYFIMGRSVNSRNRVFVTDGDGIRTAAHDIQALSDPSLVIYSPVRTFLGKTIVTNGDQTDTVADYLAQGKSFEEALRTRKFEPDAPNLTPRISGIMDKDGSYKLSILKSAGGDDLSCQRFFYEYPEPLSGQGHFIHTYKEDGSPLPSFEGEPIIVCTENDPEAFAQKIWDSLNADNRVSLFVRMINLESGELSTVIINKHEK